MCRREWPDIIDDSSMHEIRIRIKVSHEECNEHLLHKSEQYGQIFKKAHANTLKNVDVLEHPKRES